MQMSVNMLQDVRDYKLQADFTSFPLPLTATLLAFTFSSRDGLTLTNYFSQCRQVLNVQFYYFCDLSVRY